MDLTKSDAAGKREKDMTDRLPTGTQLSTLTVNPQYAGLRDFVLRSISRFADGEPIYAGRNELRRFHCDGRDYVFKSFRKPNIVNRLVYGFLRPSKAERSYRHALLIGSIGIGTPTPIAFAESRHGLLFGSSYYVSAASECRHTYGDLFRDEQPCREDVCREVGRLTALMHSHGYAHLDYGRGNILFGHIDGRLRVELVDLNRMYIGAPLGMDAGCRNFERLPATPQMHRWMAEEYATVRGYDAERCFELMQRYRSTQPGKIDGIY